MTEKWSIRMAPDGHLPSSSITVEDVLYEYDEPLIFAGKFGPLPCLFLKVKELDSADIYMASEVDDEMIGHLKEGRISVFGAIADENVWLIMRDHTGASDKYWHVRKSAVPERFFPKKGKGLYHWFDQAPDTVAQADGIISFKFHGDGLTDNGAALSKLRRLVDQSNRSFKKMLAPLSLQKSRGSTFDVIVAPLQFSSLIVSVKEPNINWVSIERNYRDLKPDDVLDEFYERAGSFATNISMLSRQRSANQIDHNFAETHFSFLSNLVELLPEEDGFLSRTEVGVRENGKFIGLAFDRSDADQLRSAVRNASQRTVTEVGLIGGFVAKAKTLRFTSPRGKEVTCHLSIRDFEALTRDTRFKSGARIKLTGSLTVRERVDLMKVDRYELI